MESFLFLEIISSKQMLQAFLFSFWLKILRKREYVHKYIWKNDSIKNFLQKDDNKIMGSSFVTTTFNFLKNNSVLPKCAHRNHTTYSRNIKWQKCTGISGLWVLNEIIQKNILKIWKKLWEPFGSYLLNSTANPAHFHLKRAGLAVLFSRQLLNGSQDFFFILVF